MSIKDLKEKINLLGARMGDDLKNGSTERFNHVIIIGIIILIGTLSFGLGRMSILQETTMPVRISNMSQQNNMVVKKEAQTASVIAVQPTSVSVPDTIRNSGQIVVGSKNSDKYHYPWCSGAKRISEANKITFNSPQEAEKAGYTLAGNCKPR